MPLHYSCRRTNQQLPRLYARPDDETDVSVCRGCGLSPDESPRRKGGLFCYECEKADRNLEEKTGICTESVPIGPDLLGEAMRLRVKNQHPEDPNYRPLSEETHGEWLKYFRKKHPAVEKSDRSAESPCGGSSATEQSQKEKSKMTVRCKFEVTSAERSGDSLQLKMNAVSDPTVPADQVFTKYTPWGELNTTIVNSNVVDTFVKGAKFYIDIVPVGDETEVSA